MPCSSQLQPTAGSSVCLPQLGSEQEEGHAAPMQAPSRGGSDTGERGQHLDLAAGRAQQQQQQLEESALVRAAVTPLSNHWPEAVDQKHHSWPMYPGNQGTTSSFTPYDSAECGTLQAGYSTLQAHCGTVQSDCGTALPTIMPCSMPLPSPAGSVWHGGRTSVSILRDACHGCVITHDDS